MKSETKKQKAIQKYINFLYDVSPAHNFWAKDFKKTGLMTNGKPYYYYISIVANNYSSWKKSSFIILKCQEGAITSDKNKAILQYLRKKGYISHGYDKEDVLEILTRN